MGQETNPAASPFPLACNQPLFSLSPPLPRTLMGEETRGGKEKVPGGQKMSGWLGGEKRYGGNKKRKRGGGNFFSPFLLREGAIYWHERRQEGAMCVSTYFLMYAFTKDSFQFCCIEKKYSVRKQLSAIPEYEKEQ